MIQTVLRREFLITCDGCGRQCCAAETPDLARRGARNRGWQPVLAHCGACFVTVWHCLTCQRARQAGRSAPESLTA